MEWLSASRVLLAQQGDGALTVESTGRKAGRSRPKKASLQDWTPVGKAVRRASQELSRSNQCI